MTLSIIIPIYNVADYLPACLDSLFSQGMDEADFEVVCVNDGSPDNSRDIIRHYAAQHSNLVYIEQENQGVSVARNNALDTASGEYVMFVDADDQVPQEALHQFIAHTHKFSEADLIVCNSILNGKYYYDWHGKFEPCKCYASAYILNNGYLRGSACGVFVKRSFLNKYDIRFLPKVSNGEDTNFMMQIMYFTNKTAFFDLDLYRVVGRDTSASRMFTPLRIDAMIEAVGRISQCRETLMDRSGNREILDYMIYTALLNLVKDTSKTKGTGYNYLRKHGVEKYCRFTLSPNTRFLRNKMVLLNKSLFAFYIIRRITTMLKG